MRVLVTGGAGFIGSNLCRRLLAEGLEVICLDDFCSGRAANVVDLARMDGFELVEADVCDPYDFDVDAIYNLACPASPPFYQADPVKTARTCFEGARNALELARRRGIPVLQASTSEVYGDPLEHPQRESYRGNVSCTGPRACYDEGKRVAETLFFDYARSYGVDARVVRIFNTYGPRMRPDDGRVVSNFIVQALRGEPLTVYGDGSQTRSLCYVDDLVEGLVRAIDAPTLAGPVNLGNPQEITVGKIARLVLDITGSNSRVEYRALPVDDPRRRKPDISHARQALGWTPRIDAAEGLARTVAYFKGELAL